LNRSLSFGLGLLVSSLTAALILIVYTFLIEGTLDEPTTWLALLVAYYAVCLFVAVVLGLPAALVMWRLNLINFWAALIIGAAIGVLVALAIGVRTLSDSGMIALVTAAVAAAIVFWLIWDRGKAKPGALVYVAEVISGKLDTYAIHGDPDDLGYGLYLLLNGDPVFIDIRQDQHLEERKKRALELHANANALEDGLRVFITAHPVFRDRKVDSIGLHSDDLDCAEVFWDPEGHTLLKGFHFVN
jgi:hypothetical protein